MQLLRTNLCSSSTGKFYDEKKEGGVNIGKLKIGSVMFVDDTTVIDGGCTDSETSHNFTLSFGGKKRLWFSHEKCFHLTVNKKIHDRIPSLTIDGIPMKIAEMVTIKRYL